MSRKCRCPQGFSRERQTRGLAFRAHSGQKHGNAMSSVPMSGIEPLTSNAWQKNSFSSADVIGGIAVVTGAKSRQLLRRVERRNAKRGVLQLSGLTVRVRAQKGVEVPQLLLDPGIHGLERRRAIGAAE